MCLPLNVIPSLSIGRAKSDSNGGQWAVDQRPFIWTPASKTSERAQASLCPTWTEILNLGGPLPYSGFSEGGGSDEPLEIGVPLSLGSNHQGARVAPVPDELGKFQSKTWEGRVATSPITKPLFSSPPIYAGSRLDILTPQLSTSSRQDSVVSCASDSPRIEMPAVQESSQSTKVSDHVDSWESSKSKEEGSQRSSWVDDLIEENGKQYAVTRRKLSSNSTSTGKRSRTSNDKQKQYNRPSVPKNETTTRTGDMSMFESLSDNEGQSDDASEGGPGISEKRRKRMLSNRASAQRSRQRRQERLDTLEVLVAQLRVESAALTRKANNSATVAKKFEEENKILRDRLCRQESMLISERSFPNDRSGETATEISLMDDDGKDRSFRRSAVPKTEATGNDGSHSNREPVENLGPNYSKDTSHHRNSRVSSRPTGSKSRPSKNEGEATEKQPQRWNNTNGSSTLDYEDFNSNLTESSGITDRRTSTRTPPPDKMLQQVSQEYGGMHLKDLYLEMAAAMNLQQTSSFEGFDPFGIDVEQGNQEMDKKDLDSRSVEEIWLDSLANC